jgi:hypothetical protein
MDSKPTSNIFKHRQIVPSNIVFSIVKTSCQVVKISVMAATKHLNYNAAHWIVATGLPLILWSTRYPRNVANGIIF